MKYFKNTSWLLGEKVLRMVVGLFVGVWVARYLGPERYGLLSYAISFVGLFTVFSKLGLDGIIVRELVKDESRREELLGTAFWLKLIGGFVVLLTLAVAVNFTSNDAYTNMLVFIVASAVIFQSFNVIDFYFQSKVLSKYVVYANIFSLGVSSAVKIALILTGAPLIAFALVVLFDNLILALGYVYFYFQNRLSLKNWKFDKTTAVDLLRDSWPLILSGLFISIYMKIDQVMIKQMLNAEAVGQYAAAVRLSEAWYFVPMLISSSLFPAIINGKKINDAIYYERLQQLFILMFWLAIFVAVFMTFFSKKTVNLLYGDQYVKSSIVLMIHIWSGVNVSLGLVWSKWILNENKQILAIYGHVVGAVLNIFFNVFLIKSFGIPGAAIATLLSYFISAFFVFSLYKPKKIYGMLLISLMIWRIGCEFKRD